VRFSYTLSFSLPFRSDLCLYVSSVANSSLVASLTEFYCSSSSSLRVGYSLLIYAHKYWLTHFTVSGECFVPLRLMYACTCFLHLSVKEGGWLLLISATRNHVFSASCLRPRSLIKFRIPEAQLAMTQQTLNFRSFTILRNPNTPSCSTTFWTSGIVTYSNAAARCCIIQNLCPSQLLGNPSLLGNAA
jgi:hypothetical protein